MGKEKIGCIILAAGKGKRMKSLRPKVLHPLCGRPMILYLLDVVRRLPLAETVVVLGYKAEEVKNVLPASFKVALQTKQRGTADAVRVGLEKLGRDIKVAMVLYADIPLLEKKTLLKLLNEHLKNMPAVTLLTAVVDNPAGYGRVVRDEYNEVRAIIEEKDANEYHKQIKEINSGVACFSLPLLKKVLPQIRPNNKNREYYLTDTISLFYRQGASIQTMRVEEKNEIMGINSQEELAIANRILQRRIHQRLMKAGVCIVDPQTTFINYDVKIGKDSEIYPFTVIENDVKIGRRCRIGPFAHLREGTRLGDDVCLGNFTEVVRSRLGPGVFMKHFSYLGDTTVASQVNIGAGAVVANFDGLKKHKTKIGKGAFIGSDAVMIAPVNIGDFARVGAGAVVTKHTRVKSHTTVVGVPARNLPRGKK